MRKPLTKFVSVATFGLALSFTHVAVFAQDVQYQPPSVQVITPPAPPAPAQYQAPGVQVAPPAVQYQAPSAQVVPPAVQYQAPGVQVAPPQYQYPPQQPPPQSQYQYPPQQYPPQGQYQQYPPQGQYQQYPPQQGQYQQYPPQPGYPPPPAAEQESRSTQFGIRGAFVMNSMSTGVSKVDKEIKIGMGFGGGFLLSIPITDMITFVPEAVFLYRTLFKISDESEGTDCDYYYCYDYSYEYEVSMTEFAISLPLMVQFAPIPNVPIYFAGGLQIDIPFFTKVEVKYTETYDGDSDSEDIDERATVDFGIALGAGYRISNNFGIDLKAVIGTSGLFTEKFLGKKKGDETLTQYGVGVSIFF